MCTGCSLSGSAHPVSPRAWPMFDHPSTTDCTVGGIGISCPLGPPPPGLMQSPRPALSPLVRPGQCWNLRPPAARPPGAACSWPQQRLLPLRRHMGTSITPRYTNACLPTPDGSWRCSPRGPGTLPQISVPLPGRRGRCCRCVRLAPP